MNNIDLIILQREQRGIFLHVFIAIGSLRQLADTEFESKGARFD